MNLLQHVRRPGKEELHTWILLLSAPVLLTVYRYYGTTDQLVKFLPGGHTEVEKDSCSHILQFVFFFLLTGILPLLYILLVRKEPLSKYGLGAGDAKFGLLFALITIPVFVIPFTYSGSMMPDVRLEYPLAKSLLSNHGWIGRYEISYLLFYYTAWEFYFRGFLLFGLKDQFGGVNAVLIQTISSCLVHIGKPAAEIIGSIPVGILFGFIALRTRSVWYLVLVHAAIGIATDLFIIFHQP